MRMESPLNQRLRWSPPDVVYTPIDVTSSLVESALNSLRQDVSEGRIIASASREGWALASTLTMNNRQNIFREWSKLASLRCDARAETDHIRQAMKRTDGQDEAPSFDVGVRQGTRVRFSNLSRYRLIAAYRAIRLLEVAGVPPVNNPGRDAALPMTMVSDLLTLAADELVATNPKLSIRLVLRICTYDKDKMLQRVLSRTHLARLPSETVVEIAQLCMGVIRYALPRLFTSDGPRGGISWIERMRVALEVLSRLALRLPPDMLNESLDIGLECYRTDRVAQQHWLGRPLGNMLERAWGALLKRLPHKSCVRSVGCTHSGIGQFRGRYELSRSWTFSIFRRFTVRAHYWKRKAIPGGRQLF